MANEVINRLPIVGRADTDPGLALGRGFTGRRSQRIARGVAILTLAALGAVGETRSFAQESGGATQEEIQQWLSEMECPVGEHAEVLPPTPEVPFDAVCVLDAPIPEESAKPEEPKPKPGPKPKDRPTARRRETTADIAKDILRLARDGDIKFKVLFAMDAAEFSTPYRNIRSAALGREALTTQRRTCVGGLVNAPRARVGIDRQNLSFIRDLAEAGDKTGEVYQINSIAGQCHNSGSDHFEGEATDLGCWPEALTFRKIVRAQRIARRNGMANNSETCAADGHMHFAKVRDIRTRVKYSPR